MSYLSCKNNKPSKQERKQIKQQRNKRKSKFNRNEVTG